MIEGIRVYLPEPERLKVFYPKHRICRSLPILQGNYIFIGEEPFNLNRFRTSIHVTAHSDMDLSTKENVIKFIGSKTKIPKSLKEYVQDLEQIEECWTVLTNYYLFKITPDIEYEEQIYKLFKSLSISDREIYTVYSKINRPIPVILSSLLTMILKSQSYKDYRGLASPAYLKLLEQQNRSLFNVRKKFLKYWLSNKSELHLLNLLFQLRRR